MIEAVNTGIERACREVGAVYVDVEDSIGENDLARDGVHLSREGSYKLGELILYTAGNIRGGLRS